MIPLGFAGKMPRAPYLTATLSIGLIIAFFVQPKFEPLYTKQAQIVGALKLAERKKLLFMQFCLSKKLTKSNCSQVSKLSSPMLDHFNMIFEITKGRKKEDRNSPITTKDFEKYIKAKEKKEKKEKKKREPQEKESAKNKGQAKSKLKNQGSKKKSEKITLEKLKKSKYGSKLYPYKNVLESFLDATSAGSWKVLGNLPSLRTYVKAMNTYRKRLAPIYEKDAHFASVAKGKDNAFYSIIRHGGLSHLFGNLLIIFFIGRYVEMFLGVLLTPLIFFLGGYVGALSYVYFAPAYDIVPMIGASGGASTLLGIFLVLFHGHKIKLLVLPFPHKDLITYLPPSLVVPAYFLAGDLAGISQGTLEAGSVAHMAHLGGFAVGLLGGWGFKLVNSTNWPYLYPFEKNDVGKFLKLNRVDHKVAAGTKILQYNRDNLFVKVEVICQLVRLPSSPDYQKFIDSYFTSALDLCLSKGKVKWAYMIVRHIPPYFPIHLYLENLQQQNALQLANYCLQQKKLCLALRMFHCYLLRYPNVVQTTKVWRTVEAIIQNIIVERQDLPKLEELQRLKAVFLFENVLKKYEVAQVIDVEAAVDQMQEMPMVAGDFGGHLPPAIDKSSESASNKQKFQLPQGSGGPSPISPVPNHQDLSIYEDAKMGKRILALIIDFSFQAAIAQVFINLWQHDVSKPYFTWVVYAGVFILYSLLPTLTDGQTIGKAAYKLKVINQQENRKLDPFKVFLREAGKYAQLMGFPLLLLSVFVHKRKFAIHDFLSGSKVVDLNVEIKNPFVD